MNTNTHVPLCLTAVNAREERMSHTRFIRVSIIQCRETSRRQTARTGGAPVATLAMHASLAAALFRPSSYHVLHELVQTVLKGRYSITLEISRVSRTGRPATPIL